MFANLEKTAFVGTKALSVIGLAALLLLAVLTLADGLGRWMFNVPIEGVRDMGGLIVAVAISCCLPMGLMERGHIKVSAIENLGPTVGRVTNFLASLLVEITMALMAWQFFLYAEKMSRAKETTWVLQLPVAPFWFFVNAIIWFAVAVQAILVVQDAARMLMPKRWADEQISRAKAGELQ